MAKKKRKTDKKKPYTHQTHSEHHGAEKRYEDIIRRKFKDSIRNLKSKILPDPEVYDGLDYDAAHQKRRIQAIIRMLQSVKDQANGICDDIPGIFSIDEEWADINTFPIPAYDFEERFSYSIVAVAIWMLDQIKEANRIDDLLSLLEPADEKVLFDIPPIWDACHSNDVIYSMVEALFYRNDPEDRSGFWPGEIRRPYMNSEITAGELDQQWERRSKFNAILDLIPQEAISKAVENYMDRYWDFFIRYFRSRKVLVDKAVQLEEDTKAFGAKLESMAENLMAANDSKTAVLREIPISQVPNLSLPGTNLNFNGLERNVSPAMITISRMDAENNRLSKREEELAQTIETLWHKCGFLNQWPEDRVKETFGEEITEIWKGFDAGDPYEMCFALVYQIDSGSDLPWCYFIGVNLHTAYTALLPWPRTRFNTQADGIWRHYDEESGQVIPGQDTVLLPKRIRVPELESWYQLQYQDSADEDELYNLGQIIYEATGCVMPRKLDRYKPALATLDRYGITGKRAMHPLMYCMTLLGEGKHQTKPRFSTMDFMTNEDPEETRIEDATTEELLSEVQTLRAENKKLRQQSYDFGREVRDEKARYEALAQKAANDAQELHDLRELVFNQQNDLFDEQKTAADINFPYRTDRKIVVFGGHDSWAREMKPKFPDIRFIDRDMLPNPDMIRRADVIWIQTNALAHKHFYRIIDEVRKNNIPLRYFTYSGVSKCAEQIVQEDKIAR